MEKKLNKWFIIVGMILILTILFVSYTYIKLTPFFYIAPLFLVLFGIFSYSKMSSKWVAVIVLILIAIIVSIILFSSWMYQTKPFNFFS